MKFIKMAVLTLVGAGLLAGATAQASSARGSHRGAITKSKPRPPKTAKHKGKRTTRPEQRDSVI